VSDKFVWQNIYSFITSQETFCDVYGPQFDTGEVDVMNAFENIFDMAVVHPVLDETK
jgi:hypothetical protein